MAEISIETYEEYKNRGGKTEKLTPGPQYHTFVPFAKLHGDNAWLWPVNITVDYTDFQKFSKINRAKKQT